MRFQRSLRKLVSHQHKLPFGERLIASPGRAICPNTTNPRIRGHCCPLSQSAKGTHGQRKGTHRDSGWRAEAQRRAAGAGSEITTGRSMRINNHTLWTLYEMSGQQIAPFCRCSGEHKLDCRFRGKNKKLAEVIDEDLGYPEAGDYGRSPT